MVGFLFVCFVLVLGGVVFWLFVFLMTKSVCRQGFIQAHFEDLLFWREQACTMLLGGKERSDAQARYQGKIPNLKTYILKYLTSVWCR